MHVRQLAVKDHLLRLLLTMPVAAFCFKFSILDHAQSLGYDWDYFAQTYEAARVSILHYHQFPWWNAWSIGGVPLYANPQFGLLSIQMLTTLCLGTLTGLRIAVLIYMIVGFWGMYTLVQHIRPQSRIIAALLSYLWCFSGFPVAHLFVGHLTFATYFLVPWFFLTLVRINRPRGWLYFGLLYGWLVEQAPHYITIELLCIGGFVAAILLLCERSAHKVIQTLQHYALAVIVALPLMGLKLLTTFQYLQQFSRPTALDEAVPIKLALSSLVNRDLQHVTIGFHAQWAWWEYCSFIGVIALGLFVFLCLYLPLAKRLSMVQALLIVGIVAALLLSLGPVVHPSPYGLVHHLPLFSQMRVPSRWIGWVSFGIILSLAWLPKKPAICALLFLALVEVWSATYPLLNLNQPRYMSNLSGTRVIGQKEIVSTTTIMPLFTATRANIDSVYGYEPIMGFYGDNQASYKHLTNRCGVERGCAFILTGNAYVTYWSPLRVILRRTKPGDICINMNPGQSWIVNGRDDFRTYRLLEPTKDFCVNPALPLIEIRYRPTL